MIRASVVSVMLMTSLKSIFLAYRPAPAGEGEKLTAEEKADRAEATIWVSGLDKINSACGIAFCLDLSATPFYIHGSDYPEGSPFP